MADNTTAGRTRKLAELRRLDSADKTRRVLAALEATISAAQPLTIAALARHARVSRRFIYDHPELRAEAERRAAQAADRTAGAITASARITVASLRADLANAKATNHRQHTNWRPCAADSARSSAATPSPNSATPPSPAPLHPNSRNSSNTCPKRKSNSPNAIKNSPRPARSTAN